MWPGRTLDYTDYPLSKGYIYLGNKVIRNKSSLVDIKGVDKEGLFFFLLEFCMLLDLAFLTSSGSDIFSSALVYYSKILVWICVDAEQVRHFFRHDFSISFM